METNILIETESASPIADTAEQTAPEKTILGMRRPIFRFYVKALLIGAPISLAIGSLAGLASFYLTK